MNNPNKPNKPSSLVGQVVGAAIGVAGIAAAAALSKKENRDKVKKVFNQAKIKAKPLVSKAQKTISNLKKESGPRPPKGPTSAR